MHDSPWIMVLFGSGMILTYVGIAYKGMHKTLAAMLGATVLTALAVAMHVLPGGYSHVYSIIAKDLNVLGVIVGTGILVDIVGHSGLFHFLSVKVVKRTMGDPGRLFFLLNLMAFLFVTFLTIVPSMLIIASLIIVITRSLNYDPKPYLISTAICANTGALVTFSSGLPNLMIGTAASIPYLQFLRVSAPYAVVAFFIAHFFLKRIFAKYLRSKDDPADRAALAETVSQFDEWALVHDIRIMRRCLIVLVLTILGFALAQTLHVGLDFIALAGGTLAILVSGSDTEAAIKKVNWTVILFFLGLFTIIGIVEATGLLERLAEGVVLLARGEAALTTALLTAFSAIGSGIVDNIPVAATLIPIAKTISSGGAIPAEPLWWGLIIGTNIGGSATPIGSISCVIALHTLHKEAHQDVGWGEFIKIGGLITAVHVVFAIVYLTVLSGMGAIPALPQT
jgi:Na+/H+ antiporter NhaD/arsenite permease-like protein